MFALTHTALHLVVRLAVLVCAENYIDMTKRRYTDSGGDRANLERNVNSDLIDVQVGVSLPEREAVCENKRLADNHTPHSLILHCTSPHRTHAAHRSQTD